MATLEEALAIARSNDRVCPQPQKWNELYELLPNRSRSGSGWEPSLPLILAAWWDTPAIAKMARFREHLEWADRHGVIDTVHGYIDSLSENDWHHIGE